MYSSPSYTLNAYYPRSCDDTARLIPLCCYAGCRSDVTSCKGGRLLSVLSRRRDFQRPIEVLSAFRGRCADRRWGFGLKFREETGRLSPPLRAVAAAYSRKQKKQYLLARDANPNILLASTAFRYRNFHRRNKINEFVEVDF